MKLRKNLFLFLLLFLGNMILYAQCNVNAGGNTTICGTSYTLQGSSSGNTNGTPTWAIVSKPAGAPDPVFSNVNSPTPNVTGMTFPGNYVFQIQQNCNPGGSATSQVTITAPGATTGFTAGPDITNIPATTGIANLSATIPAGYTPSWTYYNLNMFELNSSVVTTNATMTGTNTATPTLTLTKKADHDIDPVYLVRLRITSTNNPSCWYEDDAIVRFIPNPNVSYPNSRNFCGSLSAAPNIRYYYDENPSSPQFSDNTTNASANPSFGTTVTMNVISQPSGGNLAYDRMQNGRVYFASSFNQTVGAYVFTLTITNANGSYTTQQLTFNYNGSEPQPISFVDTAYPEQMALYSPGNSAGAVYCNRVGTTTPITINFKINPLDSPTLTSTVSTSTIIPTGGAPGIVISGAGTMNRTATLTPPSGGWRVGTYSFSVKVSNGICERNHSYYIHISDGNRPNVVVNDMTVCYPGSGVVSATIPLPAVYKGVVDSSYFQDYSGRYEFTVVSKPAGSATPTFDATTLRTFTNTSTVISNLNMQGEYVFKMTAAPPSGGDPGFIQKEYACSGTTYEDTFSVFVSTQVGANAGSDQNVVGTTTNLNGNNPGVANGEWTLIAKPSGAVDPVIVTPSSYNSNVTGLTTTGTYTFRWTITTGTCTSTDDVNVIIPGSCVNNAPTIFYNADNAGNPYGNTAGTGNLLPFMTASNIAGGTYYKTTGTETLNGVRPKSGSTLFSMSGITNAVQTSKYYSFNITTVANAPILHFNRFTAIAMDVDLILSPGGMPNVSYNLKVTIVDPDTGSEVNLGDVYINTVSGVNLPVSYKLKPGKTYQIKLYPWNSNGRTNVYLDNPRLYFSPVPNAPSSVCISNLSGTVGSVLAPYVTNAIPAGMQVRWLQNGIDVTDDPIAVGTYTPIYYNTASACYVETAGDPVAVNNNCAVPFACDTKFYLTQYGSAATDKTILYTLDNTTNPFTKTIIGESPAGMKVNGIGYNTVDNFLYGMRTDAANATHMVKIDATGTFTDLGAVTSLPAGGFNAGGFDNAGNYYIINFDSSNLYRINLSTNTATQITLSRSLKVNDIAFDSTTNLFYGYEQSTGRLVSINTSGVVTNVGSPSALGNVFFGAMYSDSNGDIFGNEDDGSGFYQFNKTTGQATKISESISAFGNDGANCSNAVITFPADLSITKTDGKTTYVPGSATTYTIVVSNNSGAYGVLGATVSDPVPAGIPAANVSYSVPVLTGGATTSITGPQTGALNDVVGLPIGGTITYTVTVNVPLAFTGNLTNTVTVTPPANSTDPNNSNNTATDTNINGVCYKPGITAGTALDSKVGITALSRAGADNTDNWPMVRKGAWLTLESKTKAFVPNRVAFSGGSPVGIAPANFVEGMMVYDTTNKCMKMYTQKAGDPSMAWHCISTQTCPD